MTYAAVLFDLFDTLVRFDRDRMPEIRVNGRTVRSTAGHLHQVLRSHAPEISLEACYEALVESWREAERLRAIDTVRSRPPSGSTTSSVASRSTRRGCHPGSARR